MQIESTGQPSCDSLAGWLANFLCKSVWQNMNDWMDLQLTIPFLSILSSSNTSHVKPVSHPVSQWASHSAKPFHPPPKDYFLLSWFMLKYAKIKRIYYIHTPIHTFSCWLVDWISSWLAGRQHSTALPLAALHVCCSYREEEFVE